MLAEIRETCLTAAAHRWPQCNVAIKSLVTYPAACHFDGVFQPCWFDVIQFGTLVSFATIGHQYQPCRELTGAKLHLVIDATLS